MSKNYALRVGIATTIMLIMIAGLLIWKSSILLRAQGYPLVGEFDTVNGLLSRGEVRYRGYRVGKVSKIVPGPKTIKVYFWVEDDVKIPEGSTLKIVFDGLVGEKYVDILPNQQAKSILGANAVLSGYSTKGIADFVDVGTQNLDELKVIIKSVRDLLANEAVVASVKKTLITLESISENMDGISRQLKGLVDDQASQKLKNTLDNFEVISEELRLLVKDEQLKEKLLNTLSESERMFRGSGDLLTTISAIELDSEVQFRYFDQLQEYKYRAQFDFWMGQTFMRFGFGNRLGDDKLLILQQSIPLVYGLRTRFGIYNTKPSIGFSYNYSRFTLGADIYDFESLGIDFEAKYKLLEVLDLIGGYYYYEDSNLDTYVWGLSLHPPQKINY